MPARTVSPLLCAAAAAVTAVSPSGSTAGFADADPGITGDASLVVTVEYTRGALALDTPYPRVSWAISPAASRRGATHGTSNGTTDDAVRGEVQVAFDVVATAWDGTAARASGRTNRSTLITLDAAVKPGLLYNVAVSVQTNLRNVTGVTRFGTMPPVSDASFVGLGGAGETDRTQCPWLRKRVTLPALPANGAQQSGLAAGDTVVAYVASYGYHELWVDGVKVGNDVLAPSVSDLAKRVHLRAYDITPYIASRSAEGAPAAGTGHREVREPRSSSDVSGNDGAPWAQGSSSDVSGNDGAPWAQGSSSDVSAADGAPWAQGTTIGLWLGPGWALFDSVNPRVTDLFNTTRAPLALAKVVVHRAGGYGPQTVAITDTTWEAKASSTTHRGAWHNSDFGGDRVNASLDDPAWASASGSGDGWAAASVATLPGRVVSADNAEPTRVREAVGVASSQWVHDAVNNTDVLLVEFARVFTGFVSVRNMTGPAGGTVQIRSSVLAFDPSKGFAPQYNMQHEVVLPLADGSASDGGSSSGGGDGPTVGDSSSSGGGSSAGAIVTGVSFEPRFSYQEVKWVAIVGLAKGSHPTVVGNRVGNIAVAGDNDADGGRVVTSTFASSLPDLDTVYRTSMETMANLVTGGMSVDCPHRERLGYLGDAHTTLETALDNTAFARFYTRWARDIVDVQGYPAHTRGAPTPHGHIPHTAPTIDGGGGPGWSGFVFVMPWEVYTRTGDTRVLADAHASQLAQLAFWRRSFNATTGLLQRWGDDDFWNYLGDWLTPHGSEGSSSVEADLFNNCYMVYCARLAAKTASALGDAAGAAAIEKNADAHAGAIHRRWYNASVQGYIDTQQTHLVMALVAGVVPRELVPAVSKALADEIATAQRSHIDTGLHGTYFMFKWLTDASTPGFGGRRDVALALTLQPTAPGYLNLVKYGYTTWPEAWGTCYDKPPPSAVWRCRKWVPGSASPAHGTLNGVGQTFVSAYGGIRRPAGAAGYQTIVFDAPRDLASQGLTSAVVTLRTAQGLVGSSWRVDPDGQFYHNVTVPPNCAGVVLMPEGSGVAITESGRVVLASTLPRLGNQRAAPVPGVVSVVRTAVATEIRVGSGTFALTSRAVL